MRVQRGRPDQADEVVTCLIELVAATDELRRRLGAVFDGGLLTHLRTANGVSYEQVVPLGRRLQEVVLISEAFKALSDAGGRYRHVEAKALYHEGMTMDEIARVLGVTRQRVSALLRQRTLRKGAPHKRRPRPHASDQRPGAM